MEFLCANVRFRGYMSKKLLMILSFVSLNDSGCLQLEREEYITAGSNSFERNEAFGLACEAILRSKSFGLARDILRERSLLE
jgi:non-homologous end joining protein Ku